MSIPNELQEKLQESLSHSLQIPKDDTREQYSLIKSLLDDGFTLQLLKSEEEGIIIQISYGEASIGLAGIMYRNSEEKKDPFDDYHPSDPDELKLCWPKKKKA